jgi:hypothetical protein
MYKPAVLAIVAAIALAACSTVGGGLTSSLPQMPMSVQSSMMRPDASSTAVKKIAWGKLPAAKAGTAIKKAVKIVLTVKGSNGKPISGTYKTPIVVTTTDTTGATKLFVNGKPATKKNPLKKSTDVLTITYSGLAILPVTLEAASGKVKAKTTFTPALSAIVYTGPTVTGPEIDLTTNTAGQSGYSGAFTATQLGWTSAPFGKAFTYTFAAIAGQVNNCPGTSSNAYTVTPGSGVAGTAFTISGASTALSGECTMTISGGAGQQISVLLTYTATVVGINAKHQ